MESLIGSLVTGCFLVAAAGGAHEREPRLAEVEFPEDSVLVPDDKADRTDGIYYRGPDPQDGFRC